MESRDRHSPTALPGKRRALLGLASFGVLAMFVIVRWDREPPLPGVLAAGDSVDSNGLPPSVLCSDRSSDGSATTPGRKPLPAAFELVAVSAESQKKLQSVGRHLTGWLTVEQDAAAAKLRSLRVLGHQAAAFEVELSEVAADWMDVMVEEANRHRELSLALARRERQLLQADFDPGRSPGDDLRAATKPQAFMPRPLGRLQRLIDEYLVEVR